MARPGLLALGVLLLAVAAFAFSVHLRNNAYLLHATDAIFSAPGDDESRAIALAHFVAVAGAQPVNRDSASVLARVEHSLPLEISPVTVLKEGFAFPDARRFGPCGQLSRTVRAVAWLRGIRSHKVLVGTGSNEHALVALEVNGAYRLFDPTFDFYWTDRQGHVASIDDVRRDTAVFAQVYRRAPHYPYSLADASYLRWSRLGLPGQWVKRLLTLVMGERWVANLDTPKLYERPWWGYGWLSTIGALACFLAAWGIRRS